MTEFITEFDMYEAALRKVNLNENVLPYVRGRLLTENVEIYAKIQKLLNCDPMQTCHRWLYDLDIENLDESEICRVNNLYKLGCDRGYLTDDEEVAEDDESSETPKTNECGTTEPVSVQPVSSVEQTKSTSDVAYTVLYSAMRDGQVKTGEAYSNSINPRSAKLDVISKLEKAGYTGITILAIEAGDPDCAGCKQANSMTDYMPQPEVVPSAIAVTTFENDDLNEADDKEDDSDDKKDSDGDNSDDSSDSDDSAGDKESDDNDDSDDKSEDSDDEKKEDSEEPDEKLKDDDDDSESDDSDDEKSNDEDDDKEDEKELSVSEKAQLKDSYKKAFKAALQKCKFETSFSELTLKQKVEFFTELSKAWTKKADPSEFMTDKEVEQLEKIVVKKN